MKSDQLMPGIYRHYKDRDNEKRYEVLGVGKDTETDADVVIYRPCYESDVAYWVRPYDMFIETIEVNGEAVPRFEKVSD